MKNKIALTAVLALLLLSWSCENKSGSPGGNEPGAPAPGFTLDSLSDGRVVSLSDFRGKPVVLNFWATWCGPCRQEMPIFESVWKEYKDKDVVFLGIDVQDDDDNARGFLERTGITYTNLYDPSGKVSGMYGVAALPATFFIDANGKIKAKNYGSLSGSEGKEELNTYLKELTE